METSPLFISYSRRDSATVDAIVTELERLEIKGTGLRHTNARALCCEGRS